MTFDHAPSVLATAPGPEASAPRGDDLTVDVLINNHNYGHFLAEAVDSALAQEHPKVNVIVVDDGSTDDSRERLKAYEGRVDVVLKDNGGQASAVNAGVERSTGDVIILLDADDLLHPEAAGRAADVFASNPDVVKIQSRMTVIDAAGAEHGVKPPPHLPLPSGDVRAAELAFPFDMVWLPTSANAYRAAALRRIMPIPVEDFPRCGADWYVNHLCALLGPVLSLDDLSASYRVHGANSYELESQSLDLGHLRHAIDHAEPTARRLAELADELGLPRPDRILSVSYLAYRLVSLRLEPARHPVAGDRVPALWRDAVRAARRRSDVSTIMRLLFVGWFTVTAVAPAPAVRYLAELFFFHERRAGLNRLVARLHTRSPGAAAVR